MIGVLHVIDETFPTDWVNNDALVDSGFKVMGLETGIVETVNILLKAWQVPLQILDHFLQEWLLPGCYFFALLVDSEFEFVDALEELILLVQGLDQFQSDPLRDDFLRRVSLP